jgi:hypothetical protein
MSSNTINNVSATFKAVGSSLKNIQAAQDKNQTKIEECTTDLALVTEMNDHPLLTNMLKELKQKMAADEKVQTEMKQESEMLMSKLQVANAEIDKRRVAYANLIEKLRIADIAAAKNKTNKAPLKNNDTALQRKLETTELELEVAKAEIEEKRVANDKLVALLKAAEGAALKNKSEITALKDNEAVLKRKVETTEFDLEVANVEIEEQRGELLTVNVRLIQECASLKGQVASLQKEKTDNAAELAVAIEQNALACAELAAVLKDKDAVTIQRDAVTGVLQAERAAVAAELTAVRAAHAVEMENKDAQLALTEAFRDGAMASVEWCDHRIASLELQLANECEHSVDAWVKNSHLQVLGADFRRRLLESNAQHCSAVAALESAWAANDEAQMAHSAVVEALEHQLRSQETICEFLKESLGKTQKDAIAADAKVLVLEADVKEETKKSKELASQLDNLRSSSYSDTRNLHIARAGEAAALNMVDELNMKNLASLDTINELRTELKRLERSTSSGSETMVSAASANNGDGGVDDDEDEDDVSEASSLEIIGCDNSPSTSRRSSPPNPEAAVFVVGGSVARP